MAKLVPFSWYGGKSSHLKWLLPVIDRTPHTAYVESFGGSAAVLLNKRPSPVEVYNDLYADVVTFFRVLRDQRDELVPLLNLTPYSREEFAAACDADAPGTDLERARRFFVRARQVRTGLATTASAGRWAYVSKDSRRGMALVVSRWLSAVDGLEDVAARLRHVQIECLDALDVIRRYDAPETLHYIDPPYLPDSRTGGRAYRDEYDKPKHLALLDLLPGLRGKVVLSGYASDAYANALAGWREHRAAAKVAPATCQEGRSDVRQEVIWTNFDL